MLEAALALPALRIPTSARRHPAVHVFLIVQVSAEPAAASATSSVVGVPEP
jgi:hypothetical protein